MSDIGKETLELIDQIKQDNEAAEHAEAIETSRLRVIGLALNYASLQVINQVNMRLPGDVPTGMPEDYLDIAHEPLDRAIATHADLLGR